MVGSSSSAGASSGAEGHQRALVLDAELDAAVQGARPDQQGRRRRGEDDPVRFLVTAAQCVREAVQAVVLPRPATASARRTGHAQQHSCCRWCRHLEAVVIAIAWSRRQARELIGGMAPCGRLARSSSGGQEPTSVASPSVNQKLQSHRCTET